MSRRSLTIPLKSQQKWHADQEAFAFLPECLGSRFDMTSAEALHPKRSGIALPNKVMASLGELDFDSLIRVPGKSRGEDFAIQECTNFFNRHGIRCLQENVSLNDNILSALEHIYAEIGLNESKKILVPTPTFGYYFSQFRSKNIGVATIVTTAENNFLPNPEELEKAIVESGATALLLCYPNNPTGAVMTEECARAIFEISERHNIFVISDEAFLNNSLSEKIHFPIAAIPGMLERSFTVTSAAKSMFVGQATSFCVSRPDIISGFTRLGGYPTKQSQKIMTAAIEDSPENRDYLARCRDYYLENIGVIESKLTYLNAKFSEQFDANATYVKPFISRPDATNVYLLDFSGLRGKKYGDTIMDSGLDVAKWLLKEASVGTVPGECFLFDEKAMLVRIVLNTPPNELALAFDNIISATASIIKSPSRAPSPSSGARFANTISQETSLGGGGS